MIDMSPTHLELINSYRRDDLLREAHAERLAQAASGSTTGVRSRLAGVLYAAAAWLDPCLAATRGYATPSMAPLTPARYEH